MGARFRWLNRERPLYVSTRAGTLTLSFADDVNISFDGEGRLVGAFLEGVTYRRALDNRVLAKWIDPERAGRRLRAFLNDEERQRVLARCYGLAADASTALAQGRLLPMDDAALTLIDSLPAWLAQVEAWDWTQLEAERARFGAIYKPVPILPPDQYLSVVVQATEGCSYNRCTFCTFYRDRRFRIKRDAELVEHIDAVQGFLRRGLQMRRSLFLADANAVIVAQHQLVGTLQRINERFPILPQTQPETEQRTWRRAHAWHLNGIYAFLSAPDALRKSSADFAELRAHNLRRVYVGLETGHDPLRRFLRKPGTAADVLRAVQTIKAGGVNVGLIFMVGVGGHYYRAQHFQQTVDLLQRMPLDRDDMVYLSPFVADADAPYVRDLAAHDIEPLSDDEIGAESERFRATLLPWARARGVRLSRYDIREFVY